MTEADGQVGRCGSLPRLLLVRLLCILAVVAGVASTGLLPRGNGVTYREWDVNPNVNGVDRRGERIVTGSDGTGYYTNDHYKSFTQFTGLGG